MSQFQKKQVCRNFSNDFLGSPPPGYAPTNNVHVPLPMGPEIPQPPIIVRKSRGYKGILMVMLAVFLMALFALTLSEIAYNRQRDENFFRLRCREIESLMQKETTTTPPPTTTAEVQSEPLFSRAGSNSASREINDPSGLIRDARLKFLRTILQKIKQHAEDMGFDGTMQVSVIEVEPQNEDFLPQQRMGKPQQQQILQNLFSHFPTEPEHLNVKSDSFLDGFGEIHQPSFLQNNQIAEQNRARFPFDNPQEPENPTQQHELGGEINNNWAHYNPFRQEQPFFRPFTNNWQLIQQQQQPQFFQQPEARPGMERWNNMVPPHIFGNNNAPVEQEPAQNGQQIPQQQQLFPQQPFLNLQQQQQFPSPLFNQQKPETQNFEFNGQPSKSLEFGTDSAQMMNHEPTQQVLGERAGQKLGKILQNIIANQFQTPQNPISGPKPTQFGQQQIPFDPQNFGQIPPIPFSQQQQQWPQQQQWIPQVQEQKWWPQQNVFPQQIDQRWPQKFEEADRFDNKAAVPQTPLMGMPPPIVFYPMQQQIKDNGVFKNPLAPEDRIQVEPPTMAPPSPIQSGEAPRINIDEEPLAKTVNVDSNIRGWTHQLPKLSLVDDTTEPEKSDEPLSTNKQDSEDKWLVRPPKFPETSAPASHGSSDSKSSETSPESKEILPMAFDRQYTAKFISSGKSGDAKKEKSILKMAYFKKFSYVEEKKNNTLNLSAPLNVLDPKVQELEEFNQKMPPLTILPLEKTSKIVRSGSEVQPSSKIMEIEEEKYLDEPKINSTAIKMDNISIAEDLYPELSSPTTNFIEKTPTTLVPNAINLPFSTKISENGPEALIINEPHSLFDEEDLKFDDGLFKENPSLLMKEKRVDFPAVKFTTTMNENGKKPSVLVRSESNAPPQNTPQNDEFQQPAGVASNPVFFQVDDPRA